MKKNMDKTSVIMTVIFAVLILGAAAGFIFASGGSRQSQDEQAVTYTDITDIADNTEGSITAENIRDIIPDAVPGSTYTYFDNGELKTVTVPMDDEASEKADTVEKTVAASKYKFESYSELTDKFMEVCRQGTAGDMHNLYYGDFLDGQRKNMKDVPTREEFDAGLEANMRSVTGFDEYEYGSVELPPTQSPGSYANYIFAQVNNGETLPLHDSDIEDAVNLVVYIDNMYQTNHFMAKIGGYWYFIA